MTKQMTPEAERRASDILHDELFASRNSGRRENIRGIKRICDQMEKDGVIISAAEVARRCGEAGPAYSTISNKGSGLGEYIRLRIAEQAALLKPRVSLRPWPGGHVGRPGSGRAGQGPGGGRSLVQT